MAHRQSNRAIPLRSGFSLMARRLGLPGTRQVRTGRTIRLVTQILLPLSFGEVTFDAAAGLGYEVLRIFGERVSRRHFPHTGGFIQSRCGQPPAVGAEGQTPPSPRAYRLDSVGNPGNLSPR